MRYYLDIKKVSHERPHIYVSPGRDARCAKLKIWLDDMKTSLEGEMDAVDIARAIKLVAAMRDDFIADYESAHKRNYIKKLE